MRYSLPAGECLCTRPDLPLLVHLVPRDACAAPAGGAPGEAAAGKARVARVLEGPRDAFEIHVAHAHDGRPGSTG